MSPWQGDLFGDGKDDEPKKNGRELRDEAFERVQANSGLWFPYAMLMVQKLAQRTPGREVMGETLRLEITDMIGPPHHHNAWGKLVDSAKKNGLLVNVGRGQMADPRSHARETPIYRLKKPGE